MTAIKPTLDDVVCPACIAAMDDNHGVAECPHCGYEIPFDAVSMRVMLDNPNLGGPTWGDVDLAAFSRWLVDAVAADNGRSAEA